VRIQNGKTQRTNKQKTSVKSTESSREKKVGRGRGSEDDDRNGEEGYGFDHDTSANQKGWRRTEKSKVAAVPHDFFVLCCAVHFAETGPHTKSRHLRSDELHNSQE
jgi:hypothetical protein